MDVEINDSELRTLIVGQAVLVAHCVMSEGAQHIREHIARLDYLVQGLVEREETQRAKRAYKRYKPEAGFDA